MSKIKVGIFGGSFNPIHNGHLGVSEYLIRRGLLDGIRLMPTIGNPWKTNSENVDGFHRFNMIDNALSSEKEIPSSALYKVEVTNFELFHFSDREYAYTCDVIRKYIYEMMGFLDCNKLEFYYIVGADVFEEIHMFKNADWLLNSGIIKIMVLTRPGYKAENPNVNTDNCIFVEVPDIDISSSKIREMVKNGEDISQLVPKEVEEYIKEHNLYK